MQKKLEHMQMLNYQPSYPGVNKQVILFQFSSIIPLLQIQDSKTQVLSNIFHLLTFGPWGTS